MKMTFLAMFRFMLVLAILLTTPVLVRAQFFNIPGNGDLLAGFRKTGAHQGTNELMVSIGNVTNLLVLPAGSSLILGNVASAQLTDAFSSDYTFLQWSVFGANFDESDSWNTPIGNFPLSTIWYTAPRANISTQTVFPVRFAKAAQASVAQKMYGVANGANTISAELPGGTNADNNTTLVREPFQVAYQQFSLTSLIGDPNNTTIGDLHASLPNQFNIEQITPSLFNSSVRSDFYEIAPAASSRPATNYVDPISGSSTSVYYVGYFDLSPAGVLTFTRASAATNPPPAPTLNVSVAGNIITISFATTNGATYSLLYNTPAGLTSSRSTWATLGSPIIGNGGVTNFTDSVSTTGRVYSVSAH